MKSLTLFLVSILLSVICVAQKPIRRNELTPQEIIVKKQILVDDIERQIKEVPYAAVRVYVRSQLVAWLWKDGKDTTERAEKLAVIIVEELYNKKSEIPLLYFNQFRSEIFALLEKNSKNIAKLLGEKYERTADEEINDAYSLFDKENGHKLVADRILNALVIGIDSEFDVLSLIDELHERKSTEILRIITTILSLEESGKRMFSNEFLYSIVYLFRSSEIPPNLQERFFNIVLNNARNAIILNSNLESSFKLLNAVISDINKKMPKLFGEANALGQTLSLKISQAARKIREREERINESLDKLSAIISEAEKSEDTAEKYLLFTRAARLALEMKKFNSATDLAEKAFLIESDSIPKIFREGFHDQFLKEVVQQALKNNNLESSEYAVKKMSSKLSMAESLIEIAKYQNENKEVSTALENFDKALILTEKSETSNLKIYTFFRLISFIREIDKTRLEEAIPKTAKAIEEIPTLNPDDKPETKNYENYVTSIMVTNFNLLPIMKKLVKENKTEAIAFINLINRKEVRIIAEFALALETFETEINASKVRQKQTSY